MVELLPVVPDCPAVLPVPEVPRSPDVLLEEGLAPVPELDGLLIDPELPVLLPDMLGEPEVPAAPEGDPDMPDVPVAPVLSEFVGDGAYELEPDGLMPLCCCPVVEFGMPPGC